MKWRRAWLAQVAQEIASSMRKRGLTEGFANNARWAWMLKPTMPRFVMVSYSRMAMRSSALTK
jgi:hypothetical protein